MQFGGVELVVTADREDVVEVSPPGVRFTSLDCRDGLLGNDHRQRVAEHPYRFATRLDQAREDYFGGVWPDWIAEIDITADGEPRLAELAVQTNPDTGVVVLVADRRCGDGVRVEDQPVIEVEDCDRSDALEDVIDLVGESSRLQVNVLGRTAETEGRQQDTSLEHEIVPIGRGRNAGQEAFERVESQQLLDITASGSGQFLDGQESIASRCAVLARRGHSRISNAVLSPGNAFGNGLASSSSDDGVLPRRLSQRFNASFAISAPSS